MGLKFRKSVNLGGGVKLNLNKQSAGVSFGGKGHRVSVNTKGKVTKTVGVPGTGLYYTSTVGKKSGKKGSSKTSSKKQSADPTWGEIFSDLGNNVLDAIDKLPTAEEKPPKEFVPKEYSQKTYRNSGRILQILAIILFILGLLLTLVFPFALILVAIACFMFWRGRKSKLKAKEMERDIGGEEE